jgi:hypothetical protein
LPEAIAMAFSRQFRALLKITSVFAAVWAAVGGLLGAFRGPDIIGGTALGAAITLAIPYALFGAMAGAMTVLLAARSESGKDISQVPAWRVGAWGAIGGVAPPLLLSGMGLVFFGASVSAVLPLLALGVVGAGVGGVISVAASAAAKAERLSPGEPPVPHLTR